MEYEISDEERLLFDDSTNPSLKHEDRRVVRTPSTVKRHDRPADRRALQKAELIPEEEQAA